MDKASVPADERERAVRDSTRALKVTPLNLAHATALLMLDEAQEIALHECLQDEPIARFMGVVEWLLSHESDEGYDPENMIRGWAIKRGAGIYRLEEEEEDQPTSRAAARIWYGSSDEEYRQIEEALNGGLS